MKKKKSEIYKCVLTVIFAACIYMFAAVTLFLAIIIFSSPFIINSDFIVILAFISLSLTIISFIGWLFSSRYDIKENERINFEISQMSREYDLTMNTKKVYQKYALKSVNYVITRFDAELNVIVCGYTAGYIIVTCPVKNFNLSIKRPDLQHFGFLHPDFRNYTNGYFLVNYKNECFT